MRRMEDDGKNYKKEQAQKKGADKISVREAQIRRREPKIIQNQTAERLMRQKIGNEDWKTAREKLIAGREYAFESKYREGPRARDLQNAIKKQLSRKNKGKIKCK